MSTRWVAGNDQHDDFGMTILPTIEPPVEESIHTGDLRLVGDRVRVYPMAVHGPVRRLKWAILISCLAIYYLLPWLRWDRGPGRPDQALLLDLWNERLYIFNWEFWPQEVYFLAVTMILAAIALFAVTSLVGRVWCGYTCPQTVWTDLFMWVERMIEGDRNARMRRDARKLDWDKAWRKAAKHAVWLGVGFWTGGAWIMYYVDAPTVTREFWTGAASVEVYFFTFLFAATTYLLAGWAREQVCTYMCPWPRFQAAMLDEQTLTVTYQARRGEPRGKKHHDLPEQRLGDCIDCNACVNVCPTGIDIRDGQQLECINCGLCVDACNTVMTKLDRPNWLINWDNLARQAARTKGAVPPVLRFVRPRTLIYAGLLCLGVGAMALAVLTRTEIGLSVQRDRAPLFVRLSDGTLRNGYTLSLVNKKPAPQELELSVRGLEGTELSLPEGINQHGAVLTVPAAADTVTTLRVLVHGPSSARGKVPLDFVLRDPVSGEEADYRSVFIGPSAGEN
ncbi:MAG TPA: cytochrome c oxidase accessory protein CcoG [Aliidongia sp.]|nr:cytochrome c oxidase accessory protein CcoG [Aliidongia sp.]